MCGLAGSLWSEPQEQGYMIHCMDLMANVLVHRGPDDGGQWLDSASGVALTHRRLSIIDLSTAGHQPMMSACGRYVIVFNGEIYNHLALREELERHAGSYTWRGHSDTETLLEAFSRWGIHSTLIKAKGMFALALWDRQDRVLTLARDRFGEKPLYYGWQNGVFLFGSELKALKAHPAFVGDVSRDALLLLLRYNYIPAPYSIYQAIHKLTPGCYAQLPGDNPRPERLVMKPFWSLDAVGQTGSAQPFRGSDSEAIDALESVLTEAVRGQMVADVPLGALLSGGLDSSLIVALMQANSPHPVKTFTIGFDEQTFDESADARAIATHLGTEHTALRVTGDDALDLLPKLPSIYDEPFADSSQIPTCLVMNLTRRHVKVALSGDGGDELFGGYGRYQVAPRDWSTVARVPFRMRQLLGLGLSRLPDGRLRRLGCRLRTARNLDDWGLAMITQWAGGEALVMDAGNPVSLLTERHRWPDMNDPVNRMMAVDAMTYLPDDILVKVDRAAMAVSLETRAPFLDRDVAEFAWALPMPLKIRQGQGKWLLRQVLYRYVPPALVDRPKRGFAIPLDDWLRGPLRDWAEDLLSVQRLSREGFLNPQPIRRAWESHLAGKASHGYALWSVLMFQCWLNAH